MNILMCGDCGVLPGLEGVIYSTLYHTSGVQWHVMTMDVEVDCRDGSVRGYRALTPEMQAWLRHLVRFLDASSSIRFYDTADAYAEHLAGSVNRETGFTPFAALRLLADLILPVDHCLYLDADVLVTEDLHPLYDTYLRKDADYAASYAYDALEDWGEMVSGVLLMNLARMRDTGTLARARRLYNTRRFRYPDQAALFFAKEPERMHLSHVSERNWKTAADKPTIIHLTSENYGKLYTLTSGKFYRYYPEFRYIFDGLETARECYRGKMDWHRTPLPE